MAKKTKEKKRERVERRFLPQSTTSPIWVKLAGGVGAALMGAGLMGQYGRPEPVPYAVWVLAAGALLVAVAVWIGTSGDPAIRVGDAGVAVEKGGQKRVPWWGVESVSWNAIERTLLVSGRDEAGGGLDLRVGSKSQAQAVAWIVKEALARVPSVVKIEEETLESLPHASREAGEVVKLEPVQVVGKRCAATDKVIAWEPDARVCPRCERVYHKDGVPETCACGGSLESLRKKPAEATAS